MKYYYIKNRSNDLYFIHVQKDTIDPNYAKVVSESHKNWYEKTFPEDYLIEVPNQWLKFNRYYQKYYMSDNKRG